MGKGVRCCALVLRAVVLASRGVRITASRGSVALGFVGRLPHVRARDLPAGYLQQVGWVLPFLWAGVWTAITIPWVQHSLAHEYEQWTTAKWKA